MVAQHPWNVLKRQRWLGTALAAIGRGCAPRRMPYPSTTCTWFSQRAAASTFSTWKSPPSSLRTGGACATSMGGHRGIVHSSGIMLICFSGLRPTNSPQRVELSSDELEMFIQTQTIDNRAKAFPRIHITYRDVDMDAQLNFYKSRGYGFLAVEMKNGVVTRILGKIDMTKNQLCAADREDGVAWNYASVITGLEYKRIATDLSGNSRAYLAIAPSHHIANLILGSIDKGINGVIDGDYGSYRSYKAVFTTRGRDVILTILLPDGNSFNRHEILLSRNTGT